MDAKGIHQRLLASLREEVRRHWGRISEIESELGISDGYLNRLCSGKAEFKLETFLRTLHVLGVDPRSFLARALDIHAGPEDYLAQLEEPGERDRPFERIARAMLEVESSEPPAAPRRAAEAGHLVKDIVTCSRSEQLRRLRLSRKYRTHAFARAYLDHLDSLRYDDAEEAARLVTGVAVNLIPALPGPQDERVRLVCRAVGIFGSARRSKGALARAARAFRLALELSRRSKLQAMKADLLQRASYLLKDFGQFERALALLNEALVVQVRLGSRRCIGRVLVDQGMILTALGDHETAVLNLKQALELLEGTDESLARNRLAAYQILAYAYEQLGELASAERWLARGVCAFGGGHAVDKAKLQWSQATVAFRRGDYERSEALLTAASKVLSTKENPSQGALVAVDLVGALLAQEKSEQAIELATSMTPLLLKLRNNRLAEAAILEMISSALEGRLNLAVVSEVRSRLRKGCTRQSSAPV